MFILKSGVGSRVESGNKTYIYFAGNDYLGLANNDTIKNNVISCIQKYGINFSASRGTTGTSDLHLELERLLAEFKDKEDAVIFPSGYLGNKILMHALQEKFSALFIDSAAHPSILDGIPPKMTNVFFYDHCNAQHLEDLLKKNNQYKPLILTDGIFPLTGEIAPVDQIYSLAGTYGAALIIDDAHATGVLGKNGRGTPEHFQLDGKPGIFQTETMSKALGAYGGFIASSAQLIDKIRKDSSIYIGSTALPAPIVAAGTGALKILKQSPGLRLKLLTNAEYLQNEIIKMGFSTTHDNTPIIPVFFNSENDAKGLSQFLHDNYIIAPYITYPVKMDKYLVRMTVSAIHNDEQIDTLLKLLKKWRDNHGIN